jgi:hypothetical protein
MSSARTSRLEIAWMNTGLSDEKKLARRMEKVKEDQGKLPVAFLTEERKRGMSVARLDSSTPSSPKPIESNEKIDDSDIFILSMLSARAQPNTKEPPPPTSSSSQASIAKKRTSNTKKKEDNTESSLVETASEITSFLGALVPSTDMFDFTSSTNNNNNNNGGSIDQVHSAQYSPLVRRYFIIYSSKPNKACPGSILRDNQGKKTWAIWTRESFKVIRFAYDSEEEARADFNKWVYVRILTDEDNNEVDYRDGWHPAPKRPLADIRQAISLNK